jgi:hypothetical protein
MTESFKPTVMGLVSARASRTNDNASGGTFIEPYPQPALGGELGLNDSDLAKSVGTPSYKLRQVLRSSGNKFLAYCAEANFLVIPCGIGEIPSSYVFDVNAAKAFIARYDSPTGFSYLAFLLQCERAVLETMPKLIEENRQLRELAAKHIRPRQVTSKGVKMISKPSVHKEKDIFGGECLLVKWERVPLDSLQPAELVAWKVRHRSKVMSGIQTAQERDLNVVQFLTETTAKNLLKP